MSVGFNFKMGYNLLKRGEYIFVCFEEGVVFYYRNVLKVDFEFNFFYVKVNRSNYLIIFVKFVNKKGIIVCWIDDNKVFMNKNN